MSRSGDFFVDNDNDNNANNDNNRTDYFIPFTCARGKDETYHISEVVSVIMLVDSISRDGTGYSHIM